MRGVGGVDGAGLLTPYSTCCTQEDDLGKGCIGFPRLPSAHGIPRPLYGCLFLVTYSERPSQLAPASSRHCLAQWFSRCDPRTSGITPEPVENAWSQDPQVRGSGVRASALL